MKYLFANWKMYLNLEESIVLAKKYLNLNLENTKMSVFTSAIAFNEVKNILKDSNINIGAQNIYWVEKGGYTGEISAQMYKDAGANYALVGHSERRHQFKETNEDVRQKLESVLNAGLIPVLCVGETKIEKDLGNTEKIVKEQICSALEGLKIQKELIVAYEPVWSIGTGYNCSPVIAEDMAKKIKNWIKEIGLDIEVIVLYGGSVRSENIKDYLSIAEISGVLVGGASAKFEDWKQIVENSKYN